jgi:adenine-specific DNA-methyltransferase
MGKFALIIGNNLYEDHALSELTSPSADVERLANLLKSPLIGGFEQVITKIDSSSEEIRSEIADFFADKKTDDLLLIYFSGHGILDLNGRLCITAKNTKRNRLSVTAISSAFISEEMDNSNSRRQILILDCCYSGAFHRGVKGEINRPVISDETFRSEGYAKVVITASNATQYAIEGNQVDGEAKESFFTHYLLEGIESGDADLDENGEISVGEWYEFAHGQVVQNYLYQTPQMWVYGQQGREMVIAKSPKLDARLTSTDLSPVIGSIDDEKILTFINNLPLVPFKLNKRLSIIEKEKEVELLASSRIIQGDNLLVMKALLPSLASKVRCVYLDPPYNTGHGRGESTSPPKDFGEIISERSEYLDPFSSHQEWLDMLYPRLILARELISDDGVIFASIDDSEIHYLRFLLDRIFGSINHICTFIWKKKPRVHSQNRTGVSIDHEYILCYSKSPDFRFKGQARDTSRYTNPDDDPNGPWVSISITGLSGAKSRPEFHYEIKNPTTGMVYFPPQSKGWKYTREKMGQLVSSGKLLWPRGNDGQPRMKRYLSEVSQSIPLSTIIEDIYFESSKWKYEDNTLFINSTKPLNLIKLLISQIPDDDFWVMDPFCGSATLGQAIIELNELDSGHRKFFLIESDPEIAKKVALKRMKDIINKSPAFFRTQVLYYSLGEEKRVER